MKTETMTRHLSDFGLLALILLAVALIVPRAGAEMMEEKKMKTMGMETMAPSGMLSGTEGHHASGTVTLHSEESGAVLVLSDIEIDKVPDGRVYLGRDGDHRRGMELGMLKQFSGTVSYPVPEGTDLAAFDSVIIWCEKFGIEIGRAPLGGGM